jgi:hypothetical protein
MTGQELTREDIKDKARGFLIRQCKIVIRTIPSTKYPKGAKYQGYVIDVLDNILILHDTYIDQRVQIYISEIVSPADIYESPQEIMGLEKRGENDID